MNNYSTTLPTGFKTWNEFRSKTNHVNGNTITHTSTFPLIDKVVELKYKREYIKARSLDEIIEFLNDCDVNDTCMLAKLQELTRVKLFK